MAKLRSVLNKLNSWQIKLKERKELEEEKKNVYVIITTNFAFFTVFLQDCSLKRIYVEHRTPNVDPEQLMAKNLDTGEFCRADLLLSGPVVQNSE